MPWKVSGVVEKRRQFVAEWLTERWTMTELCARHGISRQAGYNTVIRYQQAGWDALEERSRAPRRHPNQTAAEIERQVVELRQEHMRWGPRKLKVVLERQQPGQSWPAASTIGELLRREGLVIPRRKRRRVDPYTAPFATADAPNRIWCGDFKGWSRTQNGERIDPLTITDACSRYCAVRQWRRPIPRGCKPFSKQHSANTAYRTRSVPTTVRHLRHAPSPDCHGWRCGG